MKFIRPLLWVFTITYVTHALSASDTQLSAGLVNPGYQEKPDWFKTSFLDLGEDLDEAASNNKQLMLYFHQDGCPYCEKLLKVNFNQQSIVDQLKRQYDVIDINMWGDRAVTLISGDEVTEKALAKQYRVMFTPTLVILDNKGHTQFRMNGYYPPDKFEQALKYLELQSTQQIANNISFQEYYQSEKNKSQNNKSTPTRKSASHLHTESFIIKDRDLESVIQNSQKPVMILFEQAACQDCDTLHADLFRRLPIYKKLQNFTMLQININSADPLITPGGIKSSEAGYAKQMSIQYTPTLIFYDQTKNLENKPIFRSEALVKGFHLEAILDYIQSGAYLAEPEFQRFVQRKADQLREQGMEVDLWE